MTKEESVWKWNNRTECVGEREEVDEGAREQFAVASRASRQKRQKIKVCKNKIKQIHRGQRKHAKEGTG